MVGVTMSLVSFFIDLRRNKSLFLMTKVFLINIIFCSSQLLYSETLSDFAVNSEDMKSILLIQEFARKESGFAIDLENLHELQFKINIIETSGDTHSSENLDRLKNQFETKKEAFLKAWKPKYSSVSVLDRDLKIYVRKLYFSTEEKEDFVGFSAKAIEDPLPEKNSIFFNLSLVADDELEKAFAHSREYRAAIIMLSGLYREFLRELDPFKKQLKQNIYLIELAKVNKKFKSSDVDGIRYKTRFFGANLNNLIRKSEELNYFDFLIDSILKRIEHGPNTKPLVNLVRTFAFKVVHVLTGAGLQGILPSLVSVGGESADGKSFTAKQLEDVVKDLNRVYGRVVSESQSGQVGRGATREMAANPNLVGHGIPDGEEPERQKVYIDFSDEAQRTMLKNAIESYNENRRRIRALDNRINELEYSSAITTYSQASSQIDTVKYLIESRDSHDIDSKIKDIDGLVRTLKNIYSKIDDIEELTDLTEFGIRPGIEGSTDEDKDEKDEKKGKGQDLAENTDNKFLHSSGLRQIRKDYMPSSNISELIIFLLAKREKLVKLKQDYSITDIHNLDKKQMDAILGLEKDYNSALKRSLFHLRNIVESISMGESKENLERLKNERKEVVASISPSKDLVEKALELTPFLWSALGGDQYNEEGRKAASRAIRSSNISQVISAFVNQHIKPLFDSDRSAGAVVYRGELPALKRTDDKKYQLRISSDHFYFNYAVNSISIFANDVEDLSTNYFRNQKFLEDLEVDEQEKLTALEKEHEKILSEITLSQKALSYHHSLLRVFYSITAQSTVAAQDGVNSEIVAEAYEEMNISEFKETFNLAGLKELFKLQKSAASSAEKSDKVYVGKYAVTTLLNEFEVYLDDLKTLEKDFNSSRVHEIENSNFLTNLRALKRDIFEPVISLLKSALNSEANNQVPFSKNVVNRYNDLSSKASELLYKAYEDLDAQDDIFEETRTKETSARKQLSSLISKRESLKTDIERDKQSILDISSAFRRTIRTIADNFNAHLPTTLDSLVDREFSFQQSGEEKSPKIKSTVESIARLVSEDQKKAFLAELRTAYDSIDDPASSFKQVLELLRTGDLSNFEDILATLYVYELTYDYMKGSLKQGMTSLNKALTDASSSGIISNFQPVEFTSEEGLDRFINNKRATKFIREMIQNSDKSFDYGNLIIVLLYNLTEHDKILLKRANENNIDLNNPEEYRVLFDEMKREGYFEGVESGKYLLENILMLDQLEAIEAEKVAEDQLRKIVKRNEIDYEKLLSSDVASEMENPIATLSRLSGNSSHLQPPTKEDWLLRLNSLLATGLDSKSVFTSLGNAVGFKVKRNSTKIDEKIIDYLFDNGYANTMTGIRGTVRLTQPLCAEIGKKAGMAIMRIKSKGFHLPNEVWLELVSSAKTGVIEVQVFTTDKTNKDFTLATFEVSMEIAPKIRYQDYGNNFADKVDSYLKKAISEKQARILAYRIIMGMRTKKSLPDSIDPQSIESLWPKLGFLEIADPNFLNSFHQAVEKIYEEILFFTLYSENNFLLNDTIQSDVIKTSRDRIVSALKNLITSIQDTEGVTNNRIDYSVHPLLRMLKPYLDHLIESDLPKLSDKNLKEFIKEVSADIVQFTINRNKVFYNSLNQELYRHLVDGEVFTAEKLNELRRLHEIKGINPEDLDLIERSIRGVFNETLPVLNEEEKIENLLTRFLRFFGSKAEGAAYLVSNKRKEDKHREKQRAEALNTEMASPQSNRGIIGSSICNSLLSP